MAFLFTEPRSPAFYLSWHSYILPHFPQLPHFKTLNFQLLYYICTFHVVILLNDLMQARIAKHVVCHVNVTSSTKHLYPIIGWQPLGSGGGPLRAGPMGGADCAAIPWNLSAQSALFWRIFFKKTDLVFKHFCSITSREAKISRTSDSVEVTSQQVNFMNKH